MSDLHLSHDARRRLARPIGGSRLLRMRDLTPEQACWVVKPLFAWSAIASPARARLSDMDHYGSGWSDVSQGELDRFIDDRLGPDWRSGDDYQGEILHNNLRRLEDGIQSGRWVVLQEISASSTLVDWIDAPETPDGGYWQVNREGQRSGIGSELQWRLDEAYRERRASARIPPAIPLRGPASVEPEQARRAPPPKTAALSKAQRWKERQALIAAGRDNPSAKANAAAERLARNNVAVEKARLADHVYDPTRPVPEAWANASGNLHVLRRHGLAPEDFTNEENSNFRAQFYEPDASVFGDDMNPTIAFKGTEMTSLEDWGNNFSQAMNLKSKYYERAVNLGKKLRRDPLPIDVAGHSQGGGTCGAASIVSGKDCWSFNAAGLHPETVRRYGGAPQPSKIYAYHIRGEILTTLQSWLPLPEAVGTSYALEGKGSSISRHFISQVVDGIEKQKEEDISVLYEISP